MQATQGRGFGPVADGGFYRLKPPDPIHKVWVREKAGNTGCFEVQASSINRAINIVKREGYAVALVQVQ